MNATEQLKSALADRYSIDRLIGEGGMATVYLANDAKHQRRVALKVLSNSDQGSANADHTMAHGYDIQESRVVVAFSGVGAGGYRV